MKILIINQARMTSTRLPGKILLPVLGKPLLAFQIERVRRSKKHNQMIIATTTNHQDDILVNFCKRENLNYYRGSELDVLERFYHAAKECSADIIVRITSDCPLMDPIVLDTIIDYYLDNINSYEYVSNTQTRTWPRGLDAEVFSFPVLEEAFNEARLDYEREHVTPFLYLHPERYRVGQVLHDRDLSAYR